MKVKGLDLLREPFPKHQISTLPKPTKKDNPKGNCNECGRYHGLPAVHLDYVGHAALTDRLLEADLFWTWEPLALENGLPALDKSGGLWIKLTVCGVTRLGYGNAENASYKEVGAREKELIGDALRNAAMRFGAALDLWHKGDLHLDDDASSTSEKSHNPITRGTLMDMGHQPMPQAAVTRKVEQNESLNVVALGNRVFDIAPWKGLKFKDLAFGQKQEAFDYGKWCKGEIKKNGLDKCHADMRQFVQYLEMIQSN